MINRIDEYIELIEKLLNSNISVDEFERKYTDKFLREKQPLGGQLFDSLDWLFAKVDMHTTDEDLIHDDPQWNINESQLRQFAAETLQELLEMKSRN